MAKNQLLELLKIEDLNDLPSAIESILFSERKEAFFDAFLLNFPDLSVDVFQHIYESELAQRNQNKQDFTPNTVGLLCSMLCGTDPGPVYEPTAGNGSMIIADWWNRKKEGFFFETECPVVCWELSARSIPILLMNLSIRGIVGEVSHGDVLEQKVKAKYILTENGKYSNITKL